MNILKYLLRKYKQDNVLLVISSDSILCDI